MKFLFQRDWAVGLAVASAQIQGGRLRQEDCFLTRVSPEGLIVLLADGLGGHARGDEASYVACNEAIQALEAAVKQPIKVHRALRDCMRDAHAAVRRIDMTHVRSPATTLIAAVFLPRVSQFQAAYVGDSLCYRLRDGQLQLLFAPQVDDDILTYSVGFRLGDSESGIERLDAPLDLLPGDRFLFASDGIEVVGKAGILTCLGLPSARAACEALIRLVLDKDLPHQDNTTLVVVEVDAQRLKGTIKPGATP